MNDFDNLFKEKVKQSKSRTPIEIEERIGQTLKSLPREKKIKRKSLPLSLAAALLLSILAGSAYFSPTFANTLQAIPVIGSVFELMGDTGLQKTSDHNILTDVNEEVKIGESTLTITDVVYDGTRLSLGYTITNYTDDFYFDNTEFKLNGKKVHYGAGGRGKVIDQKDFVGIYTMIVSDEVKTDTFNLAIIIREFNDEKGKWRIDVPVSKTQGQSFLVNESRSFEDITLKMKNVTLTPVTTEINLDATEPIDFADTWRHLEYRLYDDNGMMLETFSGGGNGGSANAGEKLITLDVSVQFEPLNRIPEYLILEPYISDFSNNNVPKKITKIWSDDDPITIHQGDVGEITLLDFQFLEGETLVKVRVKGEDPYRQVGALWFTDKEGRTYDREGAPKRISDKEYIFINSYPPMDKENILEVHTVEIETPEVIDSLKIKIPLEKN